MGLSEAELAEIDDDYENLRHNGPAAATLARHLRALVGEVRRLRDENEELRQGEPCYLILSSTEAATADEVRPTVRALGTPEAVGAVQAKLARVGRLEEALRNLCDGFAISASGKYVIRTPKPTDLLALLGAARGLLEAQ